MAPARSDGRPFGHPVLSHFAQQSPWRLLGARNDPPYERVSPAHSRAMRAALRRAGNAPEVFHRRDEGHGFFDEENRAAWYATLLAFLDAHIGGES